MALLARGRYCAREIDTPEDLARARALRARAFPADAVSADDPHDDICRHVLVEDTRGGEAVCTFRLLWLGDGSQIGRSYSARFYGLDPLAAFPAPMLELGRFCIRPGRRDGDILRVAWGALTRIVDTEGVEMLFGCASFQGTDAARHAEAFAMLHDRNIAPPRWRPRIKAPRVVVLSRAMRAAFDPRRALAATPPLLRTYLTMGGRVSDHAVVDSEMNTMHIFTGVEIGAIPPARARALRAVAG